MANVIEGAQGLTANPGLVERERNDKLLAEALARAQQEREFQARYAAEQAQRADAQQARQQQMLMQQQAQAQENARYQQELAMKEQLRKDALESAKQTLGLDMSKYQGEQDYKNRSLDQALQIAKMNAQAKEQITPYQEELLAFRARDIEDRQPRRELAEKKADFTASTTLRKEFLDRPEVKDFIEIDQKVKAMDSLYEKAKSGDMKSLASIDQGIITIFNKVLDPDSVVRESEYARTPQNAPMINAISGAIQKIQKGGAGLTLQDREALIVGAKIIAESNGQKFNQTLGEYESLADSYQMDKDVVTRGLKPFTGYGNQQVQASFATEADAEKANLPVGSIITIGGRKVRVT